MGQETPPNQLPNMGARLHPGGQEFLRRSQRQQDVMAQVGATRGKSARVGNALFLPFAHIQTAIEVVAGKFIV